MPTASLLAEAMSDEELLDAVRARKRSTYNKQLDKIRFLQQRFPGFVDRKLEMAQHALEGRHVLPGTRRQAVQVGDPPRWDDNPTEDEGYIYHLNRMTWWRTLCLAYAFTDEEQYAARVIDELMDWIERCPRPTELDPGTYTRSGIWRAREVGLRMFETWPYVLDFLLHSRAMTPEVFAAYLRAVNEHGEVLATIAPELWPDADHKHYLMEMVGLLAIGCNFPELARAAEWRELARSELERCAMVQVTIEGGQIEGCPGYHNHCAYWFMLTLIIGRKRGVHFSGEYRERIGNMLTYSLHAMRPTGRAVPWGDTDAERSSPAVAGLYGWLALHRDVELRLITDFVGQGFMRFITLRCLRHVEDMEVVLDIIQQGVQPHEHPPLLSWQGELKQVALRTGWKRGDLSLFFAARSPVNNGHAHIDPLAFDFTALGKPLVVDPGRFTYRECDERYRFKSAAWHNTLTIDNADPFAYKSTFGFAPQKKGRILRVEQTPSLLAVEGMHENYAPAIHHRLLAIIDQRFVVVFDRVTGLEPTQAVHLNYHVNASGVGGVEHGNGLISTDEGARVALFATPNLSARKEAARVSQVLDQEQPSTRVIFADEGRGAETRVYATVLVPVAEGAPAPRIDHLHLEHAPQGWEVAFEVERVAYRFDWFEKSLELHRL
ncbi:MAG: alginate lyase family protein [Planctomycetota bacterium]